MEPGQLIVPNGSAQRQAGTVNRNLRKELADQVKTALGQSVRGILDTARLLRKARTDLKLGDHKSFGEWIIEQDIPLSVNTAYRMAKIVENEAIQELEEMGVLPQSWVILYELQKISPGALRIQAKTDILTPDLTLRQARQLAKDDKGPSERKTRPDDLKP